MALLLQRSSIYLPCNARKPSKQPPLYSPHRSKTSPAVSALPELDATTGAYTGLGLAAASFVGTFFVAPKLYTKNADWNKDILPTLRAASLRTVTPEAASQRAQKRQATLVDVRLPAKFEELRAQNSINVPLFTPIQKWDLPSIIRRAGFASFGVYGTEINPDFAQQAKEALRTGRELMILCENGGSIEAKAGNDKGFQSRSLKAIYYLLEEGVNSNKISHVEGGLSRWSREGLPTTSS